MRKYEVPKLKAYTLANGETVDLDAILNAPYEDISEAAERLPAYIGWFGHQRAMAVEEEIMADFEWKQEEARQYFELKNGGFQTQGFGEKMTEESLKKALLMTPQVEAAAANYASRKRHLENLTWVIEALKAKLELVRSSEATRRMEHEPDRNRGTVV